MDFHHLSFAALYFTDRLYGLSEGIPNVNGFFRVQIRAYCNTPVVKEKIVSTRTIEQKYI